METNNFFFGLFQIVRQEYINYTRHPFNLSEKWFSILFQKHYTKDIQSKFNPELFVDQDRGKAQTLLDEIKFDSTLISQYEDELRILAEWLDQFKNEYQELKDFLSIENIAINTNSKQYEQLELLQQRISLIKEKIEKQKTILVNGINSIETSLPEIAFDYQHAFGFDIKRIKEYEDDLKFINEIPSEQSLVTRVFRRQADILRQISSLNSLKIDSFNRIKIIHGKAGMGKSNISAYLINTLKNENHPVILIKAKDFNGSPDEFDKILMEQLNVPNNYFIEEVIERIDNYGKTLNKRVVLIVDGLNETTHSNEGFSQIWKNSFDAFVELLSNYKYIYFISTLRTSYITRIWSNGNIPYENVELTGFKNFDLREVVENYFNHFNINCEDFSEQDIFYFKTPLLIDLYCQMLNPNKEDGIKAFFGLNGFKDVFEKYISNLSNSVKTKLTLGTVDQVKEGIARCSLKMLDNLEANIPKMDFYSLMENQNVVNVGGTIGDEILSEYLIYIDENRNDRDVIEHTQQEVGGYLLSKKLITDYGTVDNVVNSAFFKTRIVGANDPLHQLKDDILKFLLIESDENSLIYNMIENPIIKKFTIITLQTEKINSKTIALQEKLNGTLNNKEDINEILKGFQTTLFDLESPLNFKFIKSQLVEINNNEFEYTWTKLIYENYYEVDRLVSQVVEREIILDEIKNEELVIEFLIWALETTIRELRDQLTIVLLEYFNKHPQLIFDKVVEYSNVKKLYIYERLVSICYGICLKNQNDGDFVNNIFKSNIDKIYNLQFGENPTNPSYNYIVIDSIKHLVDLAIYKKVFNIQENELKDFNNYKYKINHWIEINDVDIEIVESIYLHWTLSENPDPLRGDFVHYTIPRLEEREGDNRLINTANIYKQILNLGYVPNNTEINKAETKFKNGEALFGVKDKIDRLGKKYSWLAFFDYAGYLLNEGRLDVWREDDSEFGKHYSRLADVEIEITNPVPLTYNEKLTDIDFFSHKDSTQNWVYKKMYSAMLNLYKKGDYIMLSGFINQRESESYESRSFLLVDSFFVKKESISENIEDLIEREFDWKDDVITGSGSLSKVYFGELYWADNVPNLTLNSKELPLETEEEVERMITHQDLINYPDKYKKIDINKCIKIKTKKRISFEFEPTQIDYLWESTSKVIPSVSSTIPNTNIGKQLNLRADTSNLQILDENNALAYKSFDFKENFYSQNFDYFRIDLLTNYMKANNYLLVYQIKQHTYDRNSGDGTGDFRGMQYILSTLNE